MAWTQVDIDALDAAMKSGVRKVSFADGRSREFHDLDSMMALRKAMKAELAASESQVSARKTVIGRFVR